MTGRKLTFEAMKEDGWNAVALPIPVDASAELLMEVHTWASVCAEIYNDILKGKAFSVKKEQEPLDVLAQKLRMAQMRIVQSEWRLNALGLHYDWFDKWKPPHESAHFRDLIERMAEPGNYEDPARRPYGFRQIVPDQRESPSSPEPKTAPRNPLGRFWQRIKRNERT